MKKFICTALTLAMVVGSLAGCGSSSSKETTAASGAATEAATEAAQTEVAAATGDFDTSKEISVNSREDGSGTRGAFIELFGVEPLMVQRLIIQQWKQILQTAHLL